MGIQRDRLAVRLKRIFDCDLYKKEFVEHGFITINEDTLPDLCKRVSDILIEENAIPFLLKMNGINPDQQYVVTLFCEFLRELKNEQIITPMQLDQAKKVFDTSK
jgi:hypothetical protein